MRVINYRDNRKHPGLRVFTLLLDGWLVNGWSYIPSTGAIRSPLFADGKPVVRGFGASKIKKLRMMLEDEECQLSV